MKTHTHHMIAGSFEQRELRLEPGELIDLGISSNRFQTLRVISGSGIAQIGSQKSQFTTDDLLQVRTGEQVTIQNTGNFPLEIFMTTALA